MTNNHNLEDYIEYLKPELQEKAKECQTLEELSKYICDADEDRELDLDELDQISGGGLGLDFTAVNNVMSLITTNEHLAKILSISNTQGRDAVIDYIYKVVSESNIKNLGDRYISTIKTALSFLNLPL